MDRKDKRLIFDLDINSRKSIVELAKNIGLSKEATKYRINRLIGKSILKGFVTYLNFTELGFFGYCIYCRYRNISETKKKEIKNFLKKNEKIYWISEFGGRFDLAFSLFAKNPFDLDESLTPILSKYSNYLTDLTLITKLEAHKYNRDYLLDKKSKKYAGQKTKIGSQKLSSLEKKILKKLTLNARMAATEIAGEIKSPLSTVIYTIKNLRRKGIILGHTIILEPFNMGFQSYQLNIKLNKINKEKYSQLMSYCEIHPNIILTIKVLGEWNLELIYEIENAKRMQECLIEIRNKFGDIIQDVELTTIFEDYIKLNHYPFKS